MVDAILGDPLPSVVWYRNENLIDDSDMKTFENIVKNRIVLSNFKREDLEARYVYFCLISRIFILSNMHRYRCLAINNNITDPTEASLKIDVLCKSKFYHVYCITAIYIYCH